MINIQKGVASHHTQFSMMVGGYVIIGSVSNPPTPPHPLTPTLAFCCEIQVSNMLDRLYNGLDALAEKHGVYKVIQLILIEVR
jgi:hypothetical protein